MVYRLKRFSSPIGLLCVKSSRKYFVHLIGYDLLLFPVDSI